MTSDDAEQMALTYRDTGAEGLGLFLEMLLDPEAFKKALLALYPDVPLTPSSQENLEQIAAMLDAMGLLTPADMVAQAAELALPERELHCPYPESDTANYTSWQRGYDNRKLMQSGRLKPATPIEY